MFSLYWSFFCVNPNPPDGPSNIPTGMQILLFDIQSTIELIIPLQAIDRYNQMILDRHICSRIHQLTAQMARACIISQHNPIACAFIAVNRVVFA